MKPMSIERIAEFAGGIVTGDISGELVSRVCTDSRAVKAGDCFFAIRGDNFDGHDFIADTISKGASCVVADKGYEIKDDFGGVIIQVEDTVAALGRVGAGYRNELGCKVVGITGSAGKTTTREMISHVLGGRFECFQAKGSFNNNIGVPLTLLGADEGCEVLIVELGTNAPGEIEYLSKLAESDIAVVVNVYPAHLAGFGSVENIAREKFAILSGVRAGGVLIYNESIEKIYSGFKGSDGKRLVSFGVGDIGDIRVAVKSQGKFGSRIVVDGIEVEIPVAGRGNIENAAAAWSVCRELGISAAEFGEAMKSFSAVGMRLEIINAGGVIILSDCYNANPASMANAIESLERLSEDGRRKVFIAGDMLELGEDSETYHEQVGRLAAQAGVELLLCCGEYGYWTARGAQESCDGKIEIKIFKNTKEVCDCLEKILRSDDIILVKGSRGIKLESAVEKISGMFG